MPAHSHVSQEGAQGLLVPFLSVARGRGRLTCRALLFAGFMCCQGVNQISLVWPSEASSVADPWAAAGDRVAGSHLPRLQGSRPAACKAPWLAGAGLGVGGLGLGTPSVGLSLPLASLVTGGSSFCCYE